VCQKFNMTAKSPEIIITLLVYRWEENGERGKGGDGKKRKGGEGRDCQGGSGREGRLTLMRSWNRAADWLRPAL